MNRLSEWFIENKLLNLKPSKTELIVLIVCCKLTIG